MIKAVLLGAAGVLVVLALWLGRVQIMAFGNPNPQPIVSVVTLVNRCAVSDSDFVVQDLTSRQVFRFSNGTARVQTKTGRNLMLQLAAKYDQVRFNGIQHRAKAVMTMTADCDSSEKENATMQSLRKSLGKD